MKTKKNPFHIKSPTLKGEIVEDILLLLQIQKEVSVSELLFKINRLLPSTSYKMLKKYFVYLTDYELISYSGQIHAYKIEENGLDLLSFMEKEKERLMISDSENLTITIEERDDN